MPDTGAPWNIPYVEPADLVRDYPAADEAQALAIAAGLDIAGGLIEVKTAVKDNAFSASVTTGASTDITGLSITHEPADSANRLILLAQIGASGVPGTSIAFYDGTSLLGIGQSSGSRTRIASGVRGLDTTGNAHVPQSLMLVHTPGAGSKTYTVRVINADTSTQTLYVNRTVGNLNDARGVSAASTFTLMEVKV
jgi:hypothetical protein